MRPVNLHGVFIPLITPLTPDGDLNEAELRRLVQFLAPHVHGFVVNGTTSDFPLLLPDERARLTRTLEAGEGAPDDDACWTIRTLLKGVEILSDEHQEQFLRTLAAL